MKRTVILLTCMFVLILVPALCYGGGKSKHSKSSGTGINPKSHTVKGYVKKEGTVVAPHRRTNPNKTKLDNYGNN